MKSLLLLKLILSFQKNSDMKFEIYCILEFVDWYVPQNFLKSIYNNSNMGGYLYAYCPTKAYIPSYKRYSARNYIHLLALQVGRNNYRTLHCYNCQVHLPWHDRCAKACLDRFHREDIRVRYRVVLDT